MLTAIRDSDHKKVTGFAIEKSKNESYHCEYCKSKVIHHKSESQVRVGHFKHVSNPSCPNNSKESVAHIKTKTSILNYLNENYSSLKTIELEKWLDGKSLRADVYVETKKGTKIAIEVQASQLTIDQIISRTQKYTRINTHVLWVMVWNNSKFSNSDYISYGYFKHGHDCNPMCDHTVKLTEMELFMHSLYYKRIVFWEYENEANYPGFHIMDFDIHQAEPTEFYDEYGTFQSFDGRISKNKKVITAIHFNVPFSDLRKQRAKEFNVYGKNYSIPERLQLSYPSKKR